MKSLVTEESKIGYWKNKIKGATKTVPYPSVDNNTAQSKIKNLQIEVPKLLSERLLVLAKEKDVNIYKLFMAGLTIALSKYSLFRDLLITTSTFNFDDYGFINNPSLIFFRLTVEEEDTVKNVLNKIHKELLNNLDNQDYDYSEFKAEELSKKNISDLVAGTGLYFNELNTWLDDLEKVSCLFKIQRNHDQLELSVDYYDSLYSEEAITFFGDHVLKATEMLAHDLTQEVADLNFITDKDHHCILNDFNSTQVDYQSIPVINQFEEQVIKTPNAIAIKSGTTLLTYQELNEKSNDLANYLIEDYGLKEQEKVAVMVDRSEKILIGILAILKAGGVYIPIDLSAPKERIDFFLEDSQCVAVLTEDHYMTEETNTGKPTYISIDKNYLGKNTNLGLQSNANHLAYVIYTSGTTGKPKGSMIFNYSLTNHINWFQRQFKLTPSDSTILINSYSFDGCYGYIWATLVSGGTLHIPNAQFFDPDTTLEYIKKEEITILKVVPSTFGVLVNSETFGTDIEACKSIRVIKQGGETINIKNLRKYLSKYPNAILGNHYGATECTIGSVAHWITKDTIDEFARQPVLGSPFDNQQVYVLDPKNQLLPVGVFGEICIGGDGVGKGYLHREELTKKKFIDNPYEGSEKLYRTGDQGRWLPNGTLEFVGRLDNQVKVRGYRVELDEISEATKEFSLIRDAICLVHHKEGQDYLAVWFIADKVIAKGEIKAFLKSKLPSYMLPDYYVQLDRIPLTANGKINKKALPNPELHQIKEDKNIVAPKNDTEREILEIWESILGNKNISVDDNFFEIGGHSLKATQLVSRIHKHLNVRLPLLDVFMNPSIVTLSKLIESKGQSNDYNPILSITVSDDYDLSHSQKRMWLMNELSENKSSYNIPHAIRLTGGIDKDIFEKSLQSLVDRHEILRTIFITVAGEPRQQVLPSDDFLFELEYQDLRKTKSPELEAKRIADAAANTVFELEEKPPLTASLLQIAENEYVFLFTLHHIISDGWSTGVFTNEVLTNYTSLSDGVEDFIVPLKIQYKDFAAWQNKILSSEESNPHQAYWQDKFSGELSALELPIDNLRAKERSYKGASKMILLEEGISNQLKQYAASKDATLFMVLMSCVKTLLYRYTGQEDLIVGTPIAGREHADLEDQIGFYVNTLAIRSKLKGSFSFDEVLTSIKDNLLEAYEHQIYPFDKLVEDLNIVPETGRSPLFDVMVVMQNNAETDTEHFEANNLKYSDYESSFEYSKFDLTFSFSEDSDGLNMGIEYSTELFSEAKIERMLGHFEILLNSIVSNVEGRIDTLEYISQSEKGEILNKLAGSSEELLDHCTVTHLFEQMVHKYPDNNAIIDENNILTYAELDKKANQLANLLIEQYAPQSEDTIGIVMSRGIDFVVSMLAILKSGCSYLPIDVANVPLERIDYQLNKSSSAIFITDSSSYLSFFKDKYAGIQLDDSILENQLQKSPEIDGLETGSLAYVMFTSGTTGKPKGVMVQHKSVVRLVKDTNYTSLTREDKILQTGSLSFDLATFEIWGPLLNGGQVHVMNLNDLLHIETLSRYIKEEGITKMWFTSSWFNQLVEVDETIFDSLEQVLVGGEKISSSHVQKVKLFSPELKLTNGYGPTENTTFSICGDVENDFEGNVPLGIPITNSTVYILDKNLQILPKGVPGELILGGVGLSSGYINDPERTAEKFIPSPFSEGELLYKSGDVGSWLEDGRVAFHGRVDDQVKINGYRIEPIEIEVIMQSHELVNGAVVIVKEQDNGEKVLIGYYTSKEALDTEVLKEYLKVDLPNYMIPKFLVYVEKMPLNKNGKVDKRSLPVVNMSEFLSDTYEAASTETESRLVVLFGELLSLDTVHISVNASFFELGGHSLKAILLSGRIAKEFKTEISVKTIFSVSSIKDLARAIDNGVTLEISSISIATEKPFYEVSSVQHRMYALHQFDPMSLAYNIPGAMDLAPHYTLEQVKSACVELIKRHDSLRTTFEMLDGELVQKVQEDIELDMTIFEGEIVDSILEGFIKPFDLTNGPLLRIGFLPGKETSFLLIDMHHIITDGLSQSILIGELNDLLEGKVLEAVKYQYKDYVSWINEPAQEQIISEQGAYWVNKYSDEIPELSLPIDYQRSSDQSFEGESAQFALSQENVSFLKSLSKSSGSTLYMNILSIWTILLSKLSGQEDLAIGTPVSGRKHLDLMGIVGMFVNTLAIRLQPSGDLEFLEYLEAVKNTVLNDFENQDHPFDRLVEKVWKKRDVSRNPIFDTMFSLLTKEEFKIDFDELDTGIVFDTKTSGIKFDLNFQILDLEERIVCNLVYSTQLFKQETIANMIGQFNGLIDQLRSDSEVRLSDIAIISEQEKRELLISVNDTATDFDTASKTIDQLFEEKVSLYPDEVSVVDSRGSLSMSALNGKANQLASFMIKKGVQLNDLVGILLPPSSDIATSILGIFKAGCGYVPLDTETPSQRINHILQDSGIQWLISTKEYIEGIAFEGSFIDIDQEELYEESTENFPSLNKPGNLAYVIYTSGSTGNPKGVQIKQEQLVNYVNWFTNDLKYTHLDSTVLVSSFSFDLGHSAVFPTLSNGGTLHILKKEEYLTVDYLGKYLYEHGITFMKLTPTLFSVLINNNSFNQEWFKSIRNLMLGGEAIISSDLEKFLNYYPDKNVYNHYGPTEATIGCIVKQIDKGFLSEFKNNPTIGTPISNMRVYILDRYLQPVPKGATGQIYVSGKGISCGYLNRLDLTREKFISNPFKEGDVFYATGDLGSWTSNNEVVFKGRVDDQIKIRGYRVELEEIATVIKSLEVTRKTCVLVKEVNDNEKVLVAFIEGFENLDINQVRKDLENILPTYMVPSFLVPVDQLPITPNGKTDRQALLAYPLDNYLTENSELPSSDLEVQLLELWGEVLGLRINDVNANFFSLGGHSLRALKITNYIEQQWQKKIPLKVFFHNPTVKELAQYVEAQEIKSYEGINLADNADHYPLSHSQKRLWMIHEFSENKSAYNVPRAYQLNGDLDPMALEKTFVEIIERHEILRTVFRMVEGEPRQIILNVNELPQFFSSEILRLDENEDSLETFLSKEINKPFDMYNGPLINVKLYKKHNEEHLLIINIHHIVFDGWSTGILLEELCKGYDTAVQGDKLELNKLPIQYKDYAVWQEKQLDNKGGVSPQLEFWRNKLSGELTRFTLPETFSRSVNTIAKAGAISRVISNSFVEKLEMLAVQNQSSLYMVLLSGLNALFYRYTGQQDIIIGTVVAGREKEELKDQIGFYINTLVQRSEVSGSKSFNDLLGAIKEDVLDMQEHQYYPFDLIVSDINPPQNEGRPPLFDIMYVHQNNEVVEDYKVTLKDLEISEIGGGLSESKFDITFVTRKLGSDLQISVEYNTNIYSEEFLCKFLENFEGILKSIVDDPKQLINEIDYLGGEKPKLLNDFNSTFKGKEFSSIQANFEQSVLKFPNKVAVVNGSFNMTYGELNEQVNKMAWWILDKYIIEKDQLIAFSLERSEWQIISMLAILKVGAGFLPIDVNLPTKRKEFIVNDAEPLFVVSDDTINTFNTDAPIESIARIKQYLCDYPAINPDNISKPSDLAYVIYTSGSTGKPKGVMIEHRGNINLVTDQIRRFGITEDDRCLQFSNISFDASVYEIFISLYSGSALVLITDDIISDPNKFTEYINSHQVTFTILPPIYLSGLNRKELTGLRVLVTGGESPNVKEAQYYSSYLNYYNAYGPTEFSVVATVYEVKGTEKSIPIGKPLDNTEVYILDSKMNLLPVGCWGEIHLAGAGIARGYIKRPEQNEEKFIDNPYDRGNKLYKTGDIGRWLDDGNIEFQGRKDNMVKIRGYRVELTEIEYVILGHEKVDEVIIKYDKIRQILVAYIVTDQSIDVNDLRGFIANQLPTYMLPNFFKFIDNIPLTVNGKVNYELLPDVADDINVSKEIITPVNEIEKEVLKLWEEILGFETQFISTDDNFFELGGQSILAMKLISRVWQTFGKDISLKDFIQKPTIQDIAWEIEHGCIEKNLIVPLNSIDVNHKNLFMVPPILGSSTIFKSLADTLKEIEINCYGIQYRGFDYEETFDDSILEMAISTINEIKPHIKKEEEVNISGYSMGAFIAAEATALLEKEGYKVNLVLIDRSPKDAFSGIIQGYDHDSEKELIAELITKHSQSIELPEHNQRRIRNLLGHNLQLLKDYHFDKILDADILALEATKTKKKNKMLAWGTLTKGTVTHKLIKANHFNIIDESNAFELCKNINELIIKNSN